MTDLRLSTKNCGDPGYNFVPPTHLVYRKRRENGATFCCGLCPVSVDEGILEVEVNWVSADPMFQYISLAWYSPRQVVVLAQYYQLAG